MNKATTNNQSRYIRQYHYFSGIILALFIGQHLFNHLLVWISEDTHIAFMDVARKVYRQPVVEFILLAVVLTQAISGIIMAVNKRKFMVTGFDRMHVYSGLYLAYFMIVHVAAVLFGRLTLHLDTNLYFGAGVMATYPAMLVYIPYYGLAILSFFVHIACIHRLKMAAYTTESNAKRQANLVIVAGMVTTLLIIVKMALIQLPEAFHK